MPPPVGRPILAHGIGYWTQETLANRTKVAASLRKFPQTPTSLGWGPVVTSQPRSLAAKEDAPENISPYRHVMSWSRPGSVFDEKETMNNTVSKTFKLNPDLLEPLSP